MDTIEMVSDELQQFAHGARPVTYLVVGGISGACWAILRCMDKALAPLSWISLIVMVASVVGFVWGSVPAEFLVAVPLAVWTQGMEAKRKQQEDELKRLKEEQLALGAVGSPSPDNLK